MEHIGPITAAAAIWGFVLFRLRPLVQIQRAIIYSRAAMMFARIAAKRVYAERHQWQYCLAQARREA